MVACAADIPSLPGEVRAVSRVQTGFEKIVRNQPLMAPTAKKLGDDRARPSMKQMTQSLRRLDQLRATVTSYVLKPADCKLGGPESEKFPLYAFQALLTTTNVPAVLKSTQIWTPSVHCHPLDFLKSCVPDALLIRLPFRSARFVTECRLSCTLWRTVRAIGRRLGN